MTELWSREETIIAFNLYCKIPFNQCNSAHPLIVEYAKLLGRTPSALNMKIGNFGRFDPDLKNLGISGLKHGAKLEQQIWNDFKQNPSRLVFESEQIIAKLLNVELDQLYAIDTHELPVGTDRQTVVKQRVNQNFFRTTVLGSYNFTCCISGLNLPQLVEACHIVDWRLSVENRTNPQNGLCLNPLFHKAFDCFLLAITPDYKIIVSDKMIQKTASRKFCNYLNEINGTTIKLPIRFLPSKDLLQLKYEKFCSQL